MKPFHLPWRARFAASTVPLWLLLLTGCRTSSTGVAFQARRSVNLAVPQKNWPGNAKKTLTPGQQETLATRGAPDFVRFLWAGGPDNFATAMQVPQKPTKEALAALTQTWIYLKQKDEVIFESPVTPRERPISDKLGIVIIEGDPEDQKYIKDALGQDLEVWHYLSSGMQYTFREGKLIKQDRMHDPIPGWIKR